MPTDRETNKKDLVYIHNVILLNHKRNEIMPSSATWIDLEIIILSEVSQTKADLIWYHLYVESKKNTNELLYKTETVLQI